MTDEQIEGIARAAAAGVLRMQAAAHRAQAGLLMSMARTTDDQADAIEEGRDDWPPRAAKLQIVPLDDEPDEQAPERKTGELETISPGLSGSIWPRDAEKLSAAMVAWLDLFDDRLKGSPNFVIAVNEAAEHSLMINDGTARAVAERVRELDEHGQQREQGDEGNRDG